MKTKHNPHLNNLRNQTPLLISFRNIGKGKHRPKPKTCFASRLSNKGNKSQNDRLNLATDENLFSPTKSFVVKTGESFK